MFVPDVFQSIDVRIAVGLLGVTNLGYLVIWVVYARFFHPLHRFPGPFLASITSWWYFLTIRSWRADKLNLPLHGQYGPIVRISPDGVSVSDARDLDVVLGSQLKWSKTDFYEVYDPHIGNRTELVSTLDDKAHGDRRRIIAHLWTPRAVLEYEPRVTRVLEELTKRLDRAATGGEVVSLEHLFAQSALDTIGEVVFGKEGGFYCLRNDADYGSWLCMLVDIPGTLGAAGYVPRGMKTIYLLSQFLLSPRIRAGIKAHETVIQAAREIARQRVQEEGAPGGDDIVSKLLGIVEAKGAKIDFTHDDVAVMVYEAIMAGTDTTAITLSYVFYNIVTHPAVEARLAAELRAATASGRLTRPVRYSDAVQLPYLGACIRESMRHSPSISIGLPRVVPPQGATLSDGTFLPGGYKVTMNWNAVHFDPAVFGADALLYRPERWLEPNRVAPLHRYSFPFGKGPRVCLGMHLANMEIWKIVATLMLDFDFESVRAPVIRHELFKRAVGVDMKVTKRM